MMNGFETLLGCAGKWKGVNRLQTTEADAVDESESVVVVTPMLRGTFVRVDQSWSWKGEPQWGSMVIGEESKPKGVSIHWIDTWHNGRKVMPLVGEFNSDGVLVARGHFAVEGGPDWGWRIEIGVDGERLRINMFCVNPDGERDEGGVRAEFWRE